VNWPAIIAEEEAALRAVQRKVAEFVAAESQSADFDRELIALRDELAEARAEDHAALVEHMTRLASLREAAGRGRSIPADAQNPYFAHVRLRGATG
jgi:DNA helicase-2/ATP-dependent DNA helicase PcrA